MKINTIQSTVLPAPFSVISPSFTSKLDYLQFIALWKEVYRALSHTIRCNKLESRLRDIQTPHQAFLRARLKQVQAGAPITTDGAVRYLYEVPRHGIWQLTVANTGNTRTKERYVLGDAALANWLLWLRRTAKQAAQAAKAAAAIDNPGTSLTG